jgi:hypothetical protein
MALLVLALCACGQEAKKAERVPPPDLVHRACTSDLDCDNGLFCDGLEKCVDAVCARGPAVDCDDGVACTTDVCRNDMAGACTHVAKDSDGDGHADRACLNAEGAPLGDDCDDDDPNRFPGNLEICDDVGHDEDCNPATVGKRDQDGDTFTDWRCCNGEVCGTDCDDLRGQIRPSATEVCDHFDNNCNGLVDENATLALFEDNDGDGFGDSTKPASVCPGTVRTAAVGGDCDDADPARHPGQVEVCDNVDNNCDTLIDNNTQAANWYPDTDMDGYGDANATPIFQCPPPPGSHSLLATDCNDAVASISPVAQEECDGIDNDCNGLKDFRLGPNN